MIQQLHFSVYTQRKGNQYLEGDIWAPRYTAAFIAHNGLDMEET